MAVNVNTTQDKSGSQRAPHSNWVKALLLVAAIILLLFLLCKCNAGNGGEPSTMDGVTFGVIDTEEKSNGSSNGDAPLSASSFQVFINTRADVESDGHFEPLIQNTDENQNACWVEIIDDTGSVVYESEVVQPGYKIERDTLNDTIARGRHDCQTVFHVLRGEDKASGDVSSIVVNMILVQR